MTQSRMEPSGVVLVVSDMMGLASVNAGRAERMQGYGGQRCAGVEGGRVRSRSGGALSPRVTVVSVVGFGMPGVVLWKIVAMTRKGPEGTRSKTKTPS